MYDWSCYHQHVFTPADPDPDPDPAHLVESVRATHFPDDLSQPQCGSLDRTQSTQDDDLSQLASGIWATPECDPAYS